MKLPRFKSPVVVTTSLIVVGVVVFAFVHFSGSKLPEQIDTSPQPVSLDSEKEVEQLKFASLYPHIQIPPQTRNDVTDINIAIRTFPLKDAIYLLDVLTDSYDEGNKGALKPEDIAYMFVALIEGSHTKTDSIYWIEHFHSRPEEQLLLINDVDVLRATVRQVAKWIKEEKPSFDEVEEGAIQSLVLTNILNGTFKSYTETPEWCEMMLGTRLDGLETFVKYGYLIKGDESLDQAELRKWEHFKKECGIS